MVIDGATTTVKVAHVRLCHSRMMSVRAYPRETPPAGSKERVFDAHDKAFAFFGGACARGIYDSSPWKAAIGPRPMANEDGPCGAPMDAIAVGKDRVFNRRFVQMHAVPGTAII